MVPELGGADLIRSALSSLSKITRYSQARSSISPAAAVAPDRRAVGEDRAALGPKGAGQHLGRTVVPVQRVQYAGMILAVSAGADPEEPAGRS